MSTRHKTAILCALASPFVAVIVAIIEANLKPTGFATATLFTLVCQFFAPLWFLYWITRVADKGRPTWFEIRYVG